VIAVDTSTTLAYWAGERGDDVAALDKAIGEKRVALPPVVITELLSGRRTAAEVALALVDFPSLDILPGYWGRAGAVRRRILGHGLKARLADALIAQSCIDHDVPLLTRDADFRHYARHCGLKLA
jgi:predicted nucleic acid-binding protein